MNAMNAEIARAIVEHLAATINALTGVGVSSGAGAPPSGAGWVATFIAGDDQSTWELVFDDDGASALTRLILGSEDAPAADAVSDALSELCAQVAGAITLLPVAAGRKWRLRDLHARTEPLAMPDAGFVLTIEPLQAPLAIGLAAPKAAAPVAAVSVPAPVAAVDTAHEQLDRILDIELPVIVRFGRSELPLRTLARLGPGSLIDLGRSPDDPVDLLVSNRVIARGEVVVVGGSYGIRILDVVNPNERARSLEY